MGRLTARQYLREGGLNVMGLAEAAEEGFKMSDALSHQQKQDRFIKRNNGFCMAHSKYPTFT
eukprot:834550-Pelagomonas_calceolata.AAC.1